MSSDMRSVPLNRPRQYYTLQTAFINKYKYRAKAEAASY